MNADRNLLLGILALQMDFIDRDQLIAAMNAWVLDKSRTLEDLLVDEGHLTDARRSLLTALVQEHLNQHQNDPQQSLRTLLPLHEQREAITRQIADADVRASIALVAAGHPDDTDHTAGGEQLTTGFSVGMPTSAGNRFRVLRPHARGGLGLVSVAVDEELGREVALKEIQSRFANSETSRNRFIVEAEVTGSLEHPGVVPVYGLGHYDDGRPYYAMRFIRGHSLKEAIERFHDPETKREQDATQRRLELRQLLGRLVDVCNAIEYAHSRGVIHRDLKPDDIMLGKFGETLVVDWGLAKIVGRDDEVAATADERAIKPDSASGSAPTEMGSAIGTPAYMSPEQAAGRLDQLGPTSDVYSLGATLYSLLTGAQPFESVASGEDLIRNVQQGRFPRPRTRDRSVPPALESICLKAMATNRADRYASPSDLAADVDHFLADEPVTAHKESFSQRLGRWERRNRSYVRAGGVALLLVAVVSLSAAVGINQARQMETLQRRRADQNAHRERLAAETARAAERDAQANLVRARDAEAETAAALTLAKSEAAASEEFADYLVDLFLGSDPTGLGGGLIAVDSRGSDMSAVELLKYGAQTLDSQIIAKPEVRARLADTLGFIFTTYAEYETAKPLLDEALELRRAHYGDDHPELAMSLKNAALFYFLTGDYRKARKYDRESLAIRSRHFGPDSGPAAEMMFLLAWHISTGYTNPALLAESETLLRRAIEIQEELYGSDDQRPIFARLALAYTLLSQDRQADAMILIVGAIQKIAATQGDARPTQIISNMVRGMAAERQQNWGEAADRMGQALELAREIFGERHPFIPYFQGPIVNYLEQSGDHEKAEAALRDLVQAEREIYDGSHWVAFRLDELGAFLLRRDRADEAELVYRQALDIRRAFLDDDSLFIGQNLARLAEVARTRGELDTAEKLLREAIDVYDRATEDHPDTVDEWRAEATATLADLLSAATPSSDTE